MSDIKAYESIFSRILDKDSRLYTDVNETIETYYNYTYRGKLYDIYLQQFGEDNLYDYFQMINLLCEYLSSELIMIGDTDEKIRSSLESYYIYLIDNYEELKNNKISVINGVTTRLETFEEKQIDFTKNYMITYLSEQNNIFDTIIYRYPKINLICKKYNFDLTTKKILTLGLLIQFYIKVYIKYNIESRNFSYWHLMNIKIIDETLIISVDYED